MLTARDRSSPSGTTETGTHGYVQHEKWLIGVPFRTTASRVVRLYYVVGGAGDVSRAVGVALARANSARERQARGGGSVAAEDLEVRRITLDALGRTGLDGPGDRSAAPSW
ncbi:hypothetical protein ACN6LC_003698 [Streptomyces violaceoruber]|uniref:Uncharacterized protein n=6 Tax=Streptomyces TaxID=1883 RepID=Q9FBY2_STRCO|nr:MULTISPECIES: hypothetical protein [Streptomyces]WOY96550.1 hypothetical protein R2E43_03465 [Streptomyces violaceoruber]EFD65069.1 conserved hypothetical protein [Streptomyces lividans TK24]EOY52057.1 hypothetical protein SLI_7353 [Streptomyces lividans 1326]KKD15911.1 hypothetical protein TR66_08535 [Streptomyces sp. WM6391]MBQ0953918.1 hypothetical protein [Streptomyces sp. RK76]